MKNTEIKIKITAIELIEFYQKNLYFQKIINDFYKKHQYKEFENFIKEKYILENEKKFFDFINIEMMPF